MDYLDEMIKAHDAVMYAAGDGWWSKERRREAMLAAYNVVQTAHWGNPLAKLGNPKSWGDMSEAEKMAAWEEAFTKRTGSPALAAAEYRKALEVQRGGYREQVGDGVALMSIAHPEPCAMFPEEEETQAERIARITREMCGG